MATESKSIEQSFEEINAIIEQMDNDDTSLEKSFKMYEKAMKLVKQCNARIEKVEKKINVIENGRNVDDEL